LTLAGFEAFDFSGNFQLTEAKEANYGSAAQKSKICGNTIEKKGKYKRDGLIRIERKRNLKRASD